MVVSLGDGYSVFNLTSSGVISDDAWTHVAAVRNAQYVYIYIDGVQDENSLHFTPTIASNTEDLAVGGGLVGLIDEVRICNANKSSTLRDCDITYTYNARNQLTEEASGITDVDYFYDKPVAPDVLVAKVKEYLNIPD